MERATYHTNGFITGSSMVWILLISQGSLFLLIPVLGILHPFLAVAWFVGMIFLGFKLVTGKVTYTLDTDGLTKEVEPSLGKNLWKKQLFQFYPWTKIRNFKAGTEAGRDLQEYAYLTIKTTNGKKLEINDRKGDEHSFEEFLRVFRSYVDASAAGTLPDPYTPTDRHLGSTVDQDSAEDHAFTEQVPVEPGSDKKITVADIEYTPLSTEADTAAKAAAPGRAHVIKEKPDFYSTLFAKLLTVFFIALTIVLAVIMAVTGYGSISSYFRLLLIMIPGTAYMAYRVFFDKSKK